MVKGQTTTPSRAEYLARGLATLGLALPDEAQVKLLDYLALLAKWNRTYNLTGVREPLQMVSHHLLDSLAILPYLRGRRMLDIGTGAGLPGIPLALACPDGGFVLLDSNSKKTRFLVQVVAELGLNNVVIERARAEQYRPAKPFDTIMARALAPLAGTLVLAAPLCQAGGRLLFMKGRHPAAELAALPPGFRVQSVERLTVPGVAERHLVILSPR